MGLPGHTARRKNQRAVCRVDLRQGRETLDRQASLASEIKIPKWFQNWISLLDDWLMTNPPLLEDSVRIHVFIELWGYSSPRAK